MPNFLIQIVEDGVLLCNSNRLMGTYPITNPEIEDGSVCQFYGCYVERDFIRRTHMKVNTVTCTVVGKLVDYGHLCMMLSQSYILQLVNS